MNIEVIISTMFNTNILELLDRMNINSNVVVVNQCDCQLESVDILKYKNFSVKVINSPERGLSKSRNKALENVSDDTDIIIIADDDISYSDDYVEKISLIYSDKCIDGIICNVKRSNGKLNKKMPKKIGKISLFRACSVSLSFRYSSIKGLKFDENFGTGSNKYILGEENIFVSDCLKKGLNILTSEYILCQIHNVRNSTWYNGINEEFLYSKGASFRRMGNLLSLFLIFDFAIRKYRFYKKNISFINALKTLFRGRIEYEKECK